MMSDFIPSELQPFCTEFEFPTEVKIVKRSARAYDLHGWAVQINVHSYLYADGSHGEAPRYRAYEDLGLSGGEDDLQGKPDEDWKALSDKIEYYSRLLLMPLSRAFEMCQERGYTNRFARKGERVVSRITGKTGIVTKAFEGPHRNSPGDGTFVTVDFDGHEEVVPLLALQLSS